MAGFSDAGGDYDFALARYSANGSLDSSFGTGGKVTTDFGGDDSGQSMAIQGDGKIVVAGGALGFVIGSNTTCDLTGHCIFALARYNTNGSLDTTFGSGGKVTPDFGGDDSGNSVAIQGDGKIVVAGRSNIDFAVSRYLAAEPAPTPTPTPVPGVGWPGLLALAVGLAALAWLAGTRRARAGGAG